MLARIVGPAVLISVNASTYDVIVVGGGPAGLSGALVLGRCARRVLVCDDHRPRNAASRAMHGFLSRDGTPPGEFLQAAREDVLKYPTVDVREGEVTTIERKGAEFEATFADGTVARGHKLLIATGLVDELPPIEGLRERWGRSVFPCPFCDAWEFRDQPLAVYGSEYDAACGFAHELITWSRNLTLLTDGSETDSPEASEMLGRLGIRVRRCRIRKLVGPNETLAQILLEDGSTLDCAALFVMTRQHQRNSFARQLGCATDEENAVRTDSLQHTASRGVYVAGNAATGLQSAIMAAAEGFKAAYAINEELIADYVSRVADQTCVKSEK